MQLFLGKLFSLLVPVRILFNIIKAVFEVSNSCTFNLLDNTQFNIASTEQSENAGKRVHFNVTIMIMCRPQ